MKQESSNKMSWNRNFILICSMVLVVGGLAFGCWFKEEDSFSESERRILESFPEISVENVINGDFMEDFESYSLDQFPFREGFRSLKALISYGILGKKDNNGIYFAEGHLSKMEYPVQPKMLDHAAAKMEEIYHMYLKEQGSTCYFSIVPDKNFFLAEENGYLSMDYEELFSYMKEKVNFAEYIDISGFLSLEDYYKTDTHWRQEKILDVAEHLKNVMLTENMDQFERKVKSDIGLEAEGNLKNKYEIRELERPFYGVHYGQAAVPMEADTLYYLDSEILRQCKVTSYDTGKAEPAVIYNMEKADGNDVYEIFLSGTSALQVIENPNAVTERELIIFRDSFGSSLIPLLVDSYSKITVIDIRYVQSKMVGKLVDFQGQDTLFLYSTLILNNSLSLR